jgi:hypothetical protein
MDELHSTTNSNHGHITKRLFPALEAKIASLETSLATTANELEAKGVSLLATVTALEDKVSSAIKERLTSLELTVASPQVSMSHALRPREPPDDVPPAGIAAFPRRTAVLGGDNDKVDSTPVDGPVDVYARTRLAYNHARALNTPPQTPATARCEAFLIRNPYYPSSQPRPSLRQTTIPETLGRDSGPGMPPHIDTAAGTRGKDRSSGGDRPFMGGSVISPRHQDRDLRARTLGASRYNVIKLACLEYHIGMDGVPTLTEDILAARGFAQATANVEDVVVRYNDIILAHRKITELWYNSYAHTSGPQVDKIIQKSLSVFPRLESTKVDDVVDFYDRLQEVGLCYVITVPDRNRRPFLPDVQCAACKRVGHVAKHCDMLATTICLERT